MSLEQDILSGDIPAQDHDPDQSLEGRVVRFCIRVERTLPSGDVLPEGGAAQADAGDGYVVSASPERTRGDEHGRFIWKAQSPASRAIPMWWLGAAPAVTTEASRDLRPPRQLDLGGTRVRAAQPGGGARTDAADQRVRVRPVGNPGWAPDERFREIDAAMSGASPPLPKGYPGVVLVTTQERKQEEVFLPGAGPLIAVDRAGDPSLASEVSDLRPDDSIDPDRRARLHTMMRVVRVLRGTGFPTANGLAWQLKLSSQDGYAGGGMVIDSASKFQGEGETRADEPPGGGAKAGTAPSTEAQYGAVTRLDGSYQPPAPQDGQVGGVTFLGGTRTRPPGDGTRTRPPGGDPTRPRPPNSPPTAAGGNVVAMCSSKLSGPIDVGRADDVHRLGTTADGEPINSGHVPTSVPFIGPGGDAALDFEHGIPYSNPPSWPFRAPVHLRFDPAVTHEHVTGPKPGRWRWEAEVPFYIPDPEPPPDPPPHLPPGGTKLWIPEYGVKPGAPAGVTVGTIPEWMVELAEELGVRPGSIGVEGGDITPEQYAAWVAEGLIDKNGHLVEGGPVNRPEENRAPRLPTFLQGVRFGGGILLRAYALGDGQKNTTGTAGSVAADEETRRRADKAPDVMLLVPYAPGDGTAQGFTGVAVSPNGQRIPTTGGGVMPLPAGADPNGVLQGTATPPATPLQFVFVPDYTQAVYGTPNPETGLVEDGVKSEGVDTTENVDGIDFPKTGMKFVLLQGGEAKGTLSLTQLGSTMTLEMEGEGATTTEIVTDKVTCDVLDPRVVIMDPVAARPSELSESFGLAGAGVVGFWVEEDGVAAGQHKAYFFDGVDDVEIGASSSAAGTREVLKNAYQASGTSMSYTLAAGKLAATGDKIVITAHGDGGGALRTPRITFGGTSVTAAAATGGWTFRVTIIRTGAATQDVFNESAGGKTTASETLSGTVAITVDHTNTSGTTINSLDVEYIPAA